MVTACGGPRAPSARDGPGAYVVPVAGGHVVEEHDLVHQVEPDRLVGDPQDRAGLGGVEELVRELDGRGVVEVGGGLVEHQHRLLGQQGARDREPCPLTP